MNGPLLSEAHDVVELHTAVSSRPGTQSPGFEPTGWGLALLTVALVFWGGSYLANYSGRFDGMEFDPSPAPRLSGGGAPLDPLAATKARGKKVFENCAACHNEDGAGKPGIAPPLAKSDWVNAGSPVRIIRIVLDGITGPIKVSGEPFSVATAAMNPWRDQLTDDDIASVLTYIRSNFENSASPVAPADVKALREGTKDHAGKPWTSDQLLEIPLGGTPMGPDQLKAVLKALPADQLKALLQDLSPK